MAEYRVTVKNHTSGQQKRVTVTAVDSSEAKRNGKSKAVSIYGWQESNASVTQVYQKRR